MKLSMTRIGDLGITIKSESLIDNLVGRARAFSIRGAAQIEHGGHQPPIISAAEDDYLSDVSANIPAAGHADRLHHGRRAREQVTALSLHFAKNEHVVRAAPFAEHGRNAQAVDDRRVSLLDLLRRNSSSVRPCSRAEPIAGS